MDLVVVVGGDGNMFGVVCMLVCYDINVIGINCGNFGFLIDFDLDNVL